MQLVLGIGAEKAGTTWLGNYFLDHPEVGFSPVKELHFFDHLFLPKYDERLNKRFAGLLNKTHGLEREHVQKRIEIGRSITGYIEFMQELGKDKKCVSDITPFYAELKSEHWQELLTHFSDVKVVFILRNPVERIWSHLKMIEKIVGRKTSAKELINVFENNPEVIFRTEYYKTLTQIYAALPKDNVFLSFYEDIFSTQGQKEIDRLCDFLVISRKHADFKKQINVGFSQKLDDSERDKIFNKVKYIYREMKHWSADNKHLNWPKNWLLDFEKT